MIVFPNAKINLGLQVLRKRSDGYHDLETLFYPIPLYDILELVPLKEQEHAGHELVFQSSGLAIEPGPFGNLCEQADQILRAAFPKKPRFAMHLHKHIPSGAGLGGGSSDAAAVLRAIRQIARIPIADQDLAAYALRLGSDCPFFLLNKPALASGRGELLREIGLSLNGYDMILVFPGIHVSTAKAFESLKVGGTGERISDIIQDPVERWRGRLQNDFESTVFSMHPEIGRIKEDLYGSGAAYASMTGSGSSVYGLFRSGTLPAISFPESYRVFRFGTPLRTDDGFSH